MLNSEKAPFWNSGAMMYMLTRPKSCTHQGECSPDSHSDISLPLMELPDCSACSQDAAACLSVTKSGSSCKLWRKTTDVAITQLQLSGTSDNVLMKT